MEVDVTFIFYFFLHRLCNGVLAQVKLFAVTMKILLGRAVD